MERIHLSWGTLALSLNNGVKMNIIKLTMYEMAKNQRMNSKLQTKIELIFF
jgi:hypothetical protein